MGFINADTHGNDTLLGAGRKSGWFALLLVVANVVLGSPEVMAQNASAAGGTVDQVIQEMSDTLMRAGNRVGDLARGLLLFLFTVDLVLRFGRWAVEASSFGEVFGRWTWQLGFVCMVFFLTTIVPDVVSQLTNLALRIASSITHNSAEPSASAIIVEGLSQAVSWLSSIRFFSPETWLFLFASMISIVVTAMTVAFLVITYAEIYLVGLAGIIVLGFAGLEETRGSAISYIRLLVGKALKLMATMIIYSAINALTTAMAQQGGQGIAAVMGAIMLQVIAAILIVSLPGSVEGLVNGIGTSAAERGARFAGDTTQRAMTATAMIAGSRGVDAAVKYVGNIGTASGLWNSSAGAVARDAGRTGSQMSAGSALSGEAAANLQTRISEALRKHQGPQKGGKG